MNEDDISTGKLLSMLGNVLAYGYPIGSEDEEVSLDYGMLILWTLGRRKGWYYIILLCVDWARRHPRCPLWETVNAKKEQFIATFVRTNRIYDAL